MAWCPKCRDEYVDGIRVCRTCDAKLVDKLPAEEKQEYKSDLNKDIKDYIKKQSLENPALFMETSDNVELTFYLNILDEYEIPYFLADRKTNIYLKVYGVIDTRRKYIYIDEKDNERAIKACKESVAHLPIQIPEEDMLTDEDTYDPVEQTEQFATNNMGYILVAFAIIVVIVFVIFR